MNPLFILLIGGALYFAMKGKSVKQKREWLMQLTFTPTEAGNTAFKNAVAVATDSEIEDMYRLHTEFQNGMQVPEGPFKERILAISKKYNIYT